MPSSELRYEFSEQGLTEALKALGSTPEAVAQNLLAMGFRGHRDDCMECPVARYLLAVIEGCDRVDVGCGRAKVGRTIPDYTVVQEEHIRVDLATPVDSFIDLFDDGKFLRLDLDELDEEESDAAA